MNTINKVFDRVRRGEKMAYAIKNAADEDGVDSSEIARFLSLRSVAQRSLTSRNHIEKAMDILFADLPNTYYRTPIAAYYETNSFIINDAVNKIKVRKDIDDGDKIMLMNYIASNITIPSHIFDKIWEEKNGYGLIMEPYFMGSFEDYVKQFPEGTLSKAKCAKDIYEVISGNTITLVEAERILKENNKLLEYGQEIIEEEDYGMEINSEE